MNLKPDAPIFDRMKELGDMCQLYIKLKFTKDKTERIEMRKLIAIKLDEIQTELSK